MGTRGRAVFLAAAMLIADRDEVLAQAPSVEPGDRVRVTTSEAYTQPGDVRVWAQVVEGKLREQNDRALVIRDKSGRDREIPVSSVADIEVGTGGGSKAGLGALIGGVVGLAAGLAIGSTEPIDCTEAILCRPEDEKAISQGLYGILGMLAGASLGGLVGSSIKEETSWQQIPIDRLRMGLLPGTDHRLVLVASRSF